MQNYKNCIPLVFAWGCFWKTIGWELTMWHRMNVFFYVSIYNMCMCLLGMWCRYYSWSHAFFFIEPKYRKFYTEVYFIRFMNEICQLVLLKSFKKLILCIQKMEIIRILRWRKALETVIFLTFKHFSKKESNLNAVATIFIPILISDPG